MKRVNTFVAMGSEVQENKEKKEEGMEETAKGSRKKMLGRKRAGKEQQKESSKKQKVEEEKELEEVDVDDEVELKKLLVIKKDKDIAIDVIPLATKLPFQRSLNDKDATRNNREDLEALGKSVRNQSKFGIINDRMERAATTVSSIEAGQDSGTINKTQSMITPARPSSLRDSSEGGPGDSPLPRVNTLGSGEGSMQQNKLMKLCIKLSEKVTSLESDLKQKKLVYDVALTKLINKDAPKQEKKIDMDVGDVSIAGADINAASVLVSTAGVGVSTASPTVSTASPTINTASPTRIADVFAVETLVYIRRSATKDKEQEAKFNAEQEELLARETTKDEANSSAADIDWDDVQAQI
ncbi:hypothetical protein Tco_0103251 [Tanacetum coccineum]